MEFFRAGKFGMELPLAWLSKTLQMLYSACGGKGMAVAKALVASRRPYGPLESAW